MVPGTLFGITVNDLRIRSVDWLSLLPNGVQDMRTGLLDGAVYDKLTDTHCVGEFLIDVIAGIRSSYLS